MKNIIITGANGNLGRTVTHSFLNKGYNVIATIKKEEDKKHLPAHPNLQTAIADLTSESQAAALVQQAITKWKKIDAALLLAGGFTMGDLQHTRSADLQQQIQLNFETAYHVAQPLLQHMLQTGYGRLVFVGAKPALDLADGKNKIAYSLSKSLLFHLAGLINETTKGTNVTATVLVPSIIDTPDNRKDMPQADPSRWARPEDLAELMLFICSENAHALREGIFKMYNNS